MKVVILAGGRGTRISEESLLRPKPMVTIGGKPIIWHIMKIYSYYGFKEFIVCCGYKGEFIKKYFIDYLLNCKMTKFDLDVNGIAPKIKSDDKVEDWKIVFANTGLNTMTAGRVMKIKEYIGEDEEFMLTYGDGVSDIKIDELVDFHRKNKKIITISSTQPEGRFGAIKILPNGMVDSFQEKARSDQSFVNIGFMVLNKRIFDYLDDETDMLEGNPFAKLSANGEMSAFKHNGFWSPMDNINDRAYLEKLWMNQAPWKVW